LLLFPGGVLLVLTICWPESSVPLARLRDFLQQAHWPVLLLGSLLAWRFNRIRLLRLLLWLAVTLVLQSPMAGRWVGGDLMNCWRLLAPFNLLLLAALPEWGIFSLRALSYPLLLGAQVAGLLLWGASLNRLAAPLMTHVDSLPGSLVFPVLVTLLLGWRFIVQQQSLSGYFCWLPAILWSSHHALQPFPLTASLIGLGGMIALLETSHALAYRDDLTGLPGRRALNEQLVRLPRSYLVAMVDIDHFKQFNDKHGHDVGDQVLRMVATRLATVKRGGRAYRYGGEEFSLLFAGRDKDAVQGELERLRGLIEQSRFVTRRWWRSARKPAKTRPAARSNRQLKVTVSIGMAARNPGESAAQVLKRADQALYRAKRAGRNRVMG